MNRERGEELWLRFLASGTLTPEERRDLLEAMNADRELRRQLLADSEIDGLLRALGASDQDAEGFVKAILDFLSAEGDESGFLNRVESRMLREGILPQGDQEKPSPAKFRSNFGNPESVQYNSSRMPAIVHLEGSEEDFARLLVFHKIISKDQLQKALEERQHHAARGRGLETLRDALLRTKTVSSGLLFDVLREASKVVQECTKCEAVHHVHYYHPHSRYFCSFCHAAMRVTDPGQSMKWQPGELAASVNEISGTFTELPTAPEPSSAAPSVARAAKEPSRPNPLDDPSATAMPAIRPPAKPAAEKPLLKPATLPPLPDDRSVTIAPGGDETMLDMGVTPRTSSKPKPLPKLPDEPAPEKAPAASVDGLPSWMDQDESMLDLGAMPRAGAKPEEPKPFELPKDPPATVIPPDRSVTMTPGGGETMLGMGDTPRTSSKPFALPKDKPAGPPPGDRSITVTPGGGETMLDMGSTPRSSSAPGGAPEGPAGPVDLGATIIPTPGAGETMLDMGPGSGVTPPKRNVSDMSTSIFGSRKALPTGLPKAPPELPKLPGSSTSNPAYDVTTKQGGAKQGSTKTDATFLVSPNTGSASTVDRTQIQQTTPKTGTGGSSAAISNAKALPPEVAQAAKDPNRVFGKYILMSELGRGGAGVVYKAWDTLILQYVALKFIRNQDDDSSDTSSGSSQIEEFQREARMSVRLRHPNIVRIYELGCMSNRYYLSMEYIEGGNLLAMIHGGKERNTNTRFNSDPLKFLKIMQNIALAVDYAHNTKPPIIHRDLKPHNVLVDLKGNPYVVDFGLAKEVDQGDGATLTGVVKGTPTYMAPEQAEGRNRDVDPRTDVYALGAIMYEMLTGKPPYTGESVPEILRKIATEIPERPNDVIARESVSKADSTSKISKTKTKALLVPKPLETICLKALEKGKPDRYQSAKELAEDIDRYLKDEDILAQEPGLYRRIRRKVRQHPFLSAAAAAILMAAITGGIVFKTLGGKDDGSGKKLVESLVWRGEKALNKGEWGTLDGVVKDLAGQDRMHPKIAIFEKALKDHKDLVERTELEWGADLDRVDREPLSQVIGGLREKYKRCPELQEKFLGRLNIKLTSLKGKVLDEAAKLVGSGARPAWVEEIIKTQARAARDQAQMLIGLSNDPDFKFSVEQLVQEASEGLGRVIAYQGTWTLQVNVAPYAEVTVSRAEKELATDFTPIGLQELEVVGTSYIVELCWPSRENAKVKLKEEIKDLHHGQTVVIRGDLSKAALKQERK